MQLRPLVAVLLLLLLANAGYFLWSRGDLAGIGAAPAALHEREPQRLGEQLRPELLQIRRDGAASPAGAAGG